MPRPITPDAFFFENELNTVILPSGKTSDFLESMYTNIENTTRNSLDRLRQSDVNSTIELFDKMHLFLFLLFLHWRLPSNIKYVDELSKSFFSKCTNLSYFALTTKSGEDVPEEVKSAIKSSSAFKKASKLVVPFAPFYHAKWSDRLRSWKFSYTGDGGRWHLVGDNPVVTRGIDDHDPIKCLNEFVFPVSGRILLISTNKPVSKELSPEFIIQFNVSVIERAQRFVACQRKDLLEALIKDYKIHVQFEKQDVIINEMFNMLEK